MTAQNTITRTPPAHSLRTGIDARLDSHQNDSGHASAGAIAIAAATPTRPKKEPVTTQVTRIAVEMNV